MVDGEKYVDLTYTAENVSVNEPLVPGKEGYDGKWEEYSLDFTDIVVNAIYTKKAEVPTCSDEDGDNGSPGGCGSAVSGKAVISVFFSMGVFILIRRKKEE